MAGNIPSISVECCQCCHSSRDKHQGHFGASQFARGTFGAGATISKKAFEVAANILVA